MDGKRKACVMHSLLRTTAIQPHAYTTNIQASDTRYCKPTRFLYIQFYYLRCILCRPHYFPLTHVSRVSISSIHRTAFTDVYTQGAVLRSPSLGLSKTKNRADFFCSRISSLKNRENLLCFVVFWFLFGKR